MTQIQNVQDEQQQTKRIWLIYENNLLLSLVKHAESEEEAKKYEKEGYIVEEVEVKHITSNIVKRLDSDIYYKLLPPSEPLGIALLEEEEVIEELFKDLKEEIEELKEEIAKRKEELNKEYKRLSKEENAEAVEESIKILEIEDKLLEIDDKVFELESEIEEVKTAEEALKLKESFEKKLKEIRKMLYSLS